MDNTKGGGGTMNRVIQQRMTQISRQNNFLFSRQGQDQQTANQTHGGAHPHQTQAGSSPSREPAHRQYR